MRDAPKEPRFFESAEAFRAWLAEQGATTAGLWVGFVRADAARDEAVRPDTVRAEAVRPDTVRAEPAARGLTSTEAVEQALCFGWIDGVVRPIDDRTYAVWYTRRRNGSRWSAVNVRRVGELTARGVMTPDGLAAFEARRTEDQHGYTYSDRPDDLPEPWLSRLLADADAAHYWKSQSPSYRRSVVPWIVEPKGEATRERHFEVLLASCRRREVIPPLRSVQGRRKRGAAQPSA